MNHDDLQCRIYIDFIEPLADRVDSWPITLGPFYSVEIFSGTLRATAPDPEAKEGSRMVHLATQDGERWRLQDGPDGSTRYWIRIHSVSPLK